MTEYTGPERRSRRMSEELIEEIAEKAAEKAIAKLTEQAYVAVGRSVVQKFFTIIGIITLGLYAWAKQHGWIE